MNDRRDGDQIVDREDDDHTPDPTPADDDHRTGDTQAAENAKDEPAA